MTRRRTPLWKRLITGILLLGIVGWMSIMLAVLVFGSWDRARPSDAVVVLGAAQYMGRPSPVLRARLDHAIDLYSKGVAPLLIVTGGKGSGDTTSEAAVSREYAMQQGVPDSAILMEIEGRTTSESLRTVATMMKERKLDSVVLVSDPFHMLRLTVLGRRLGLQTATSPTSSSPISRNPAQAWRYVLSETIKVPLAFAFERKEE
jgi:uncharacterized SAM-binding protein YcdF (DUF218 family)